MVKKKGEFVFLIHLSLEKRKRERERELVLLLWNSFCFACEKQSKLEDFDFEDGELKSQNRKK